MKYHNVLLVLVALVASSCSEQPCRDFPNGCPATTSENDVVTPDTPVPEVNPCKYVSKMDRCSVLHVLDGDCVEVKPEACHPGFVRDTICECVVKAKACDDLDDNDSCTVDVCDPMTGIASHPLMDCDDNNPVTSDTCVSGQCVHQVECQGDRFDENPCTFDYCDGATGLFVHKPIVCVAGYMCQNGTCELHCASDLDCKDDNPCTQNMCIGGNCSHPSVDCDDGKEATFDQCNPNAGNTSYTCSHPLLGCSSNCDDGDPCTMDTCQDMECLNVAMMCGAGSVCQNGQCVPAPCQNTSDCDDDNPCTVDFCQTGQCMHLSKPCETGAVCNASSGECVQLEECPGGCDDGNSATTDFCEGGVCVHHQPTDCGPGTSLDPSTGLCVPAQGAECEDNVVDCAMIENMGYLIAVAICQEGQWHVVESCGFYADQATCVYDADGYPVCNK